MIAPLDDPAYEPRTRPDRGRVPDVVARWGPRSQLRWFKRFWGEIDWRAENSNEYYVHSAMHTGPCCESCIEDEWAGYPTFDDACCCRARRIFRLT